MPTARRTIITVLLVAAAATALAFATGAAVIDGPADNIADDRLAVQPADGPNGDYAYLNNDEEIVVDISASNENLSGDFEGVNPDSLASAGGIFTITYTANESARVWIDHPEGNVTFVADGGSIEGEANGVTLAPNETVTVGLRIDTRGAAAGTTLGGDNFDIRANVTDPADASPGGESETAGAPTPGGSDDADRDRGSATTVRRPAVDDREFAGDGLSPGETATFDADEMRLSDDAALDEVRVTSATGGDVAFETVGSSEPVPEAGPLTDAGGARPEAYFELTHSFSTEEVDRLRFDFSVDRAHLAETGADPADVALYRRSETEPDGWERLETEPVDPATSDADRSTDRVHLTAVTDDFSVFAVATERPVMATTSAALERSAVAPGENVTVRATVANEGGADGGTVALTAGDDPVATELVALAPDETTTVAFEAAFDEPGTYDLAVNGTPAGTLSVGDSAGDDAGDGAGAVDGDNATDGNAAESTETGGAPVEEPGAIGLSSVTDLFALLVFALASVAIARRMSNWQ